jgi:hypothetical protein
MQDVNPSFQFCVAIWPALWATVILAETGLWPARNAALEVL